jgi:hypothetical protein
VQTASLPRNKEGSSDGRPSTVIEVIGGSDSEDLKERTRFHSMFIYGESDGTLRRMYQERSIAELLASIFRGDEFA